MTHSPLPRMGLPHKASARTIKMNLQMGMKLQFGACVTMGFFLCWIISVQLISSSGYGIPSQLTEQRSVLSTHPTVPRHVQELIDAIRAAAQVASGGREVTVMTQEERGNWTMSNPCRSRLESSFMYSRRKGVRDMAANPLWDMVLQEYEKLHRACTQGLRGSDSFRTAFLSGNTTTGCKFAIADVDAGIPAGLSNRALSIASTILFGILTQRVVLVAKTTLMTTLTCEPFMGSSWELGDFTWYPGSQEAYGLWAYHNDIFKELDNGMIENPIVYMGAPQSKYFAGSMRYSQYHPDERFFCDTEQASLESVTWLYFTGCLYTVPKLFAIPKFRDTLEELFPGRFVLTQLLRSVMLPADDVWDQAVGHDSSLFSPEEELRVGIQVRYYYGKLQYDEMNDIINERIMTCALENDILPRRLGRRLLSLLEERRGPVKIFVASLFTGLSDHLKNVYLSEPSVRGANVTLVQLSNNYVQTFGYQADVQSFVEILLLSFSDTLLNTPTSTFGGLAQAYGSLTPYMIETKKGDGLSPCLRDTTVDVCYHTAAMQYNCTYDNVNGLKIGALAPYFKSCNDNLYQAGVQLVTDHASAVYESQHQMLVEV